METIWMIQEAAAVGNWWLAASSWQCTCSCIRSRAEFFGETSNHPGDSAPLQPRFWTLWLLAFSKIKMTFEREKISDCWKDSGKYDRVDGNWENCVRSQGAYFKGDWGVIILCTMFLVSSSINVSIFHITWLDNSRQTSCSCLWQTRLRINLVPTDTNVFAESYFGLWTSH